MARLSGLSVVFHVFYLNLIPFSMPSKLQNGLSFFSFLYNFGRFTRPQTPPFLSPWPPKTPPLHPCSDARNPLFSYSKTPFGMSHFAFWGIPFHHLGYFNACLCPHIGDRFTLSSRWFSHFRGKNGRQNVCLSPQLSGNQIPSHQITVNLSPKLLIHI